MLHARLLAVIFIHGQFFAAILVAMNETKVMILLFLGFL